MLKQVSRDVYGIFVWKGKCPSSKQHPSFTAGVVHIVWRFRRSRRELSSALALNITAASNALSAETRPSTVKTCVLATAYHPAIQAGDVKEVYEARCTSEWNCQRM